MAKVNRKKAGRSRRDLFKKGLMKQVDKSIRKHDMRKKGFSIIADDNIPIWRPGYGTHIIDIIPYLAGEGDPQNAPGTPVYTFTYYVHRMVGPANADVICLEQMGKGSCPICDHRNRLREEGKDDTVWKKLFPKERNLYNVVCYDLNEEKKGVRVWDESEFYSQRNIAPLAREKGRGGSKDRKINFVDPDKGKSIEFEIQQPVSRDDYKKYLGFKFRSRDYKIKDSILEDAYTLDELIEYPSEDMVNEIYWGEDGRDEVEPDESNEYGDENEDPYEILEEAEHIKDLLNLKTDYDLEAPVTKKTKFKKAKRLLKKALDEQWEPPEDEDEEEDDDESDDPFEMLESAEDNDDLKEIVKQFDLNIKIKKKNKFKKNKILVKKALKNWEPEEDGEEENFDPDDIRDMSWKKLVKFCKQQELDVDPDDYDDEEELSEAIIDELDLEDDEDN